MPSTSTTPPVSQTESDVARYIDLQLQAIAPKTVGEVAVEAGLPQRNMLSMIRTGVTKLPFERLPGIARALKVDQNHLFRMALKEYLPHVQKLFDAEGREVVSANEMALLAVWRDGTGYNDPSPEPVLHEVRGLGRRARAIGKEAALSPRARHD